MGDEMTRGRQFLDGCPFGLHFGNLSAAAAGLRSDNRTCFSEVPCFWGEGGPVKPYPCVLGEKAEANRERESTFKEWPVSLVCR